MNAADIKKSLSLKAMSLFGLLENKGEGIYNKFHIIDVSEFMSEDVTFRVYHSDCYCFEVTKYELQEDDGFDDFVIDGFAYQYSDDRFPGFNRISLDYAINLIKNII